MMGPDLTRRKVLAGAAAVVAACTLPAVPAAARPAWIAIAEAEIAADPGMIDAWAWAASHGPLTVIANAGAEGRDVAGYSNCWVGFLTCVREGWAQLRDDGRLYITDAG